MRIGIDVDGCLANYCDAFLRRLIVTSGRDLTDSLNPIYHCWDWPQAFGYTEEEVKAAMDSVAAQDDFWLTLNPYPLAQEDLFRLATREALGHDVYFITNRYGVKAKQQTEIWLRHCGFLSRPTVLISAEKALCVEALRLDCYIDDNVENVMDVVGDSSCDQVFLMSRPWNTTHRWTTSYLTRVDSVREMLQAVERSYVPSSDPTSSSDQTGLPSTLPASL